MRVVVLGHRGMLGHVVCRYLRQLGAEVITTDTRYTGAPSDRLIAEVSSAHVSAIVNCIGATPNSELDSNLFTINGLLPHHLSAILGNRTFLLHASTDGVFDGTRGMYTIDDLPNAVDAYGLSKRIGELWRPRANGAIIRASIVGPSLTSRGLLAWYLSRTTLDGFENHRWNGITTLEWAMVCAEILTDQQAFRGVLCQPTCAYPVTKYELLLAFGAAFDHHPLIRPVIAPRPIDRTLVPTATRSPISDQLRTLRSWYSRSAAQSNEHSFDPLADAD